MDMLSALRDILSMATPVVDASLGALAITLYFKLKHGFEEFRQLQSSLVASLSHLDQRVTTLERERYVAPSPWKALSV